MFWCKMAKLQKKTVICLKVFKNIRVSEKAFGLVKRLVY